MDQWYDDAAKTIATMRDKPPVLALFTPDIALQTALAALNIRSLVIRSPSHWLDSGRHAQAVMLDAAHVYQYTQKSLRDVLQHIKRRKTPWVLQADGAAWSRSVALTAQQFASRAPVAVVANAADAQAVQQGGGFMFALANRLIGRGNNIPQVAVHADAVYCGVTQKMICFNNTQAPRSAPSIADALTINITAALVSVFSYYNAPIAAAALAVQSARVLAQNSSHGNGSFMPAFIDSLARFSAEKAARCVQFSTLDESPL